MLKGSYRSKVIKAEMYLKEVYVGLGGNIGDSCAILWKAIQMMAELPEIQELAISRFYCTTPVSPIPQDPYINAVCRFRTSYSMRKLLQHLQKIEKDLGKIEKLKEAPRIIDLDILFYDSETCNEIDLQIPHPRWRERLFVIAPLADLTNQLCLPDPNDSKKTVQFDVQRYLQEFPNVHDESVAPLPEILRNLCKPSDLKNSPLAKVSP